MVDEEVGGFEESMFVSFGCLDGMKLTYVRPKIMGWFEESAKVFIGK